MYYAQQDIELNKKRKRKELLTMLGLMLPFLALCAAGFIARNQAFCTAGLIAACAAAIFWGDLRVAPVMRYGRFLNDVTTGLTHKTAGALVRLGKDEVYEDGVYFHEVILNIYEDMSVEGERRFLLEGTKSVDPALLGKDVAVTSHGNFVLNVEPLGEKEKDA